MGNTMHTRNPVVEDPEDDPLLRPRRVAQMLDVDEGTLANWRTLFGQTRLAYIKLNKKDVRYRRSVVRAFIAEREDTTSQRMGRKGAKSRAPA